MKLARVALDFESELDDTLMVNISKMSVTFPYALCEGLKNALTEPRRQARLRYDKRSVALPVPPTPRIQPVPASTLGSISPTEVIPSEGPTASAVPSSSHSVSIDPTVTSPNPSDRTQGTMVSPIGTGSEEPDAGNTSDTNQPCLTEFSASNPDVPQLTIIKKVTLDGKLWRIRESFSGGRVLEVDMHEPRLVAIHLAIQGKAEAVGALADLLAAADEAAPEMQVAIKTKFGV